MSPLSWLSVYCLLNLLASLAGGWIPLWVHLTHKRMEIATSFVAGLMLGVGLLHLLPHAVIELQHAGSQGVELGPHGAIDQIVYALLAGFLLMFFIERFFCFHHHDAPPELDSTTAPPSPALPVHDHAHDHDAGTAHDHDLTWSGAAVGLTIHSVIEGVALAASVEAEWAEGNLAALAGMGTFLVIFLHKPFDSLTLGTLMARGRWSRKSRHLVNGLFALAIPVGAVLFHLGIQGAGPASGQYLAWALAFSAGTFLCIATSDILPELQFHRHDRVKLSCALLLGLALALVVGLFESHGHDHSNHEQPGKSGHDQSHSHE